MPFAHFSEKCFLRTLRAQNNKRPSLLVHRPSVGFHQQSAVYPDLVIHGQGLIVFVDIQGNSVYDEVAIHP